MHSFTIYIEMSKCEFVFLLFLFSTFYSLAHMICTRVYATHWRKFVLKGKQQINKSTSRMHSTVKWYTHKKWAVSNNREGGKKILRHTPADQISHLYLFFTHILCVVAGTAAWSFKRCDTFNEVLLLLFVLRI